MLPSPPTTRPRFFAPSTATLKVLYQLAYISSGTALGVGALCAEERRRRTKVVQRIADNAKRIRQSPRYARGAHTAVALREEVEMEERCLEEDEGVRGPELPSVVEREYGKVGGEGLAGEKRRVRRRSKGAGGGRPEFVREHESGTSTSNRRSSRQSLRYPASEQRGMGRSWSRRGSGMSSTAIPCIRTFGPVASPTVEGSGPSDKPYKRLVSDFVSYTKLGKHLTRRSDMPMVRLAHEGIGHKRPKTSRQERDNARALVISRLSLIRDAQDDHHHDAPDPLRSPADISQNIDEFFRMVSVNSDYLVPVEVANFAFNQLFTVALREGSLRDIQSLAHWAIATQQLNANHLQKYAKALGTRTDFEDVAALEELTTELRMTKAFLDLDSHAKTRFDTDAHVLMIILGVCEADEQHAFSSRLIANRKGPEDNPFFARKCEWLLANRQPEACLHIFRLAMKRHSSPETLEPLADLLLDAFLQAGHLSLSLKLLRLKWSSGFRTKQTQQVDSFISGCAQTDNYNTLRASFRNFTDPIFFDGELQPNSYISLCKAFAGGQNSRDRNAFRRYFDSLSDEARISVSEGKPQAQIAVLRATWDSTRQRGRARKYYDIVSKHHNRELDDTHMAGGRALDLAMVEIYIEANATQPALHILARLNREQPDGIISSLLALTFAKKGDWGSFARVWQALKHDRSLVDWNAQSMRAFNTALRLYSTKHTAAQTSDLVLQVMNELGFQPNVATWTILLCRAAADKDLQLTIHWLQYRKSLDRPFKVDGDVAASLLKAWYLDFRHSYVLVMWLCRTLTLSAPSLMGSGLLNVVKEAVGYDLRRLAGGNAPLMEPLIKTRQGSLLGPRKVVPDPGYIYNWKLWYEREKPLLSSDEASISQVHDIESGGGADSLGETRQSVAGRTSTTDMQTERLFDIQRNTSLEAGDTTTMSAHPAGKRPCAPEPSIDYENKTFDSAFGDLRPQYSIQHADESTSDSPYNTFDLQTLERDMILGLSIQQYQTTLDLYHSSLSATGVPASPLTLEVAVEASIRLHNSTTHAISLLDAARASSMNVSCAMGPLLIHQMRHTTSLNRSQANKLRLTTLEYYRMNAQNGWNVKHHVGVHAAHTLIKYHRAEHGINLLDGIFHSEWAHDRPLDIAAMSVWLLGYAALQHVDGMRWVVETVLCQDIQIDMAFLRSLKRAKRPSHLRADGSRVFPTQNPKVGAIVEYWRGLCRTRREEQMRESKVFGKQLVKLLVKAANEDAPAAKRNEAVVLTHRQRRRERLDGVKCEKPDSARRETVVVRKVRHDRSELPGRGLIKRLRFDPVSASRIEDAEQASGREEVLASIESAIPAQDAEELPQVTVEPDADEDKKPAPPSSAPEAEKLPQAVIATATAHDDNLAPPASTLALGDKSTRHDSMSFGIAAPYRPVVGAEARQAKSVASPDCKAKIKSKNVPCKPAPSGIVSSPHTRAPAESQHVEKSAPSREMAQTISQAVASQEHMPVPKGLETALDSKPMRHNYAPLGTVPPPRPQAQNETQPAGSTLRPTSTAALDKKPRCHHPTTRGDSSPDHARTQHQSLPSSKFPIAATKPEGDEPVAKSETVRYSPTWLKSGA